MRTRESGFVRLLFSTFVAVGLNASAVDAQQPDARDEIRTEVIHAYGRSIVCVIDGEEPICQFYVHGRLEAELQPNSDRSVWAGTVRREQADGSMRVAGILRVDTGQERTTGPVRISYNERNVDTFTLRSANADPDEASRVHTFVVTSFGRAVSTGRFFARASSDELNPGRQFSQAWYFDSDLSQAETHRNTLEMADLSGWVLAWDEQHCIQHSDGARVAKVRLFPDGRVVANTGRGSGLAESRIPVADVRELVDDVIGMASVSNDLTTVDPGAILVSPEAGETVRLVAGRSELGSGLWDQFQDQVSIRRDGETYTLNVVHAGPDGRPTRIPFGWDEMSRRLAALMRK